MPLDRFVRLPVYPSVEDVGRALRAYVGEAGVVEWWDACGRWGVTMPGVPTTPRSCFSDHPFGALFDDVRAFEVFVSDDQLDVMTRGQDEFVRAVADGFAAFCARQWKGTVET